jgi:hypothetical protein
MRSNTVLLAEATGMLGRRIADHLLETGDDVALRLLVRPAALADPGKRSGLDPLVERDAGLVEFDDEADVASFWGTGEERFDATTVDDIARYAARVVLDPSIPSGKFAVAGQ